MRRRTETGTRTLTLTKVGTEDISNARLTPLEEKVLRMRYGIPAGPDHPLEYLGGRDPQTRAKLAMMEKEALDHLRPNQCNTKKARLIEKLRDL